MKTKITTLLLFSFLIIGCLNPLFSQTKKSSKAELLEIWSNENNNDSIRIVALSNMIWDFYLYTKTDSALYFSQHLLSFSKQKNSLSGQIEGYNLIGNTGLVSSNYKLAFEYYELGIALADSVGNEKSKAAMITNKGSIYQRLGNYNKALELYVESLVLKEKLNDKPGITSTLGNIGTIHRHLGNYPLAISYLNRAMNLAIELNMKRSISNISGNMAAIFYDQGDFERSKEYTLKNLELKMELGDKAGMATSYTNLGPIFQKFGNNKEAFNYFYKSLELFDETGNKNGKALTYSNIGRMYLETDSIDLAISFFEKGLEIYQTIENNQGISHVSNNLSEANYLNSNFKQAIQYAQQALSLSKSTGEIENYRIATSNLISAFLKTNAKDSVLKHTYSLRSIIERDIKTNYMVMTTREKELYFATMDFNLGVYFDVALHYKKDQFLADTAYNMALFSKGLSLRSSTAMRKSILSSNDATLIQLYDDWLELRKEIAKLYSSGKNVTELESQAAEMERKLVISSGVFDDYNRLFKQDWKSIQAQLNPNEAAIEFVHFKSRIEKGEPTIYMAIVITKDCKHPYLVRLCTEDDLKIMKGSGNEHIKRLFGKNQPLAYEMYQKVWGKELQSILKNTKKIYYSPSGLLHKVPFHVLHNDNELFLCEQYDLRQQGSTGNLLKNSDIRINSKDKFTIVGGISYTTDKNETDIWSYLPGTLEETKAIEGFLKKKNIKSTFLNGSKANEKEISQELAVSNVFHLATHGFFFSDPEMMKEELAASEIIIDSVHFRGQNLSRFNGSTNYANWSFINNKNPLMRSGVVLAGANSVWDRDPLALGEDGILTADEVSNMDLRNTKLVVLSACETGLGDIKGSEGVFGLQRAFKMAGANYLIMSLWQVSDKETSEFMQLFYQNLLKEKEVPIAFRKTQLMMQKKYEPYFWAAFVLIN